MNFRLCSHFLSFKRWCKNTSFSICLNQASRARRCNDRSQPDLQAHINCDYRTTLKNARAAPRRFSASDGLRPASASARSIRFCATPGAGVAWGADSGLMKSAICLSNSVMVLRWIIKSNSAKSYGELNIRVFPRRASLQVLRFNAKSA